MRRILSALAGILILTPFIAAAPEKWAAAIDAYTEADKSNPPPSNGVVFVGSSSIKMWKSLQQDFPKLPVINRGFGGSQMSDSIYYADRIVTPYQPKTVVVYAGDNDINGGKSPEVVLADFNAFRAKVHTLAPTARIIFIAIKPSPRRWNKRDEFTRANALIAAECKKDRRLGYLDIWTPMLTAQGEPRPEFYLEDMLHMNEKGYALWTKHLAPMLK